MRAFNFVRLLAGGLVMSYGVVSMFDHLIVECPVFTKDEQHYDCCSCVLYPFTTGCSCSGASTA